MVRPWPYGLLGEKNGVAWILTYACVIEWPLRAVRRSLGHLTGLLRTFSSLQASKVLTRELRLLNFLWRYLSWDERANWGGANMGIVCSGHFWQLGSTASLATETKGGEILIAFFPKHSLRSDFRVPNFKFFRGGACPQTPLASSHLINNGRANLK